MKTRILIDFFVEAKVYQLWDLLNDEVYNAPDFKSIEAAQEFCEKNNLTYKIGSTII